MDKWFKIGSPLSPPVGWLIVQSERASERASDDGQFAGTMHSVCAKWRWRKMGRERESKCMAIVVFSLFNFYLPIRAGYAAVFCLCKL